MRMQTQDDLLPLWQIAMHPFNLVGIDVGARHLHRRRQVKDDLVINRRLPDFHYSRADLAGVVELGLGKAFRGIFHLDMGFRHFIGELPHQLCPVGGNFLDARAVHIKHNASL